jgi:site-specific recombinase XerC
VSAIEPWQDMPLVQSADRNPASVYIKSLAKGSQRTMTEALDKIAGEFSNGQMDRHTFPWHELRYQHTQAIRAHLRDKYAPATVNKHLCALRRVLKEAWRLGIMDAADYARAVDIPNLDETALPAGRHVAAGELTALVDVCRRDPSPIGIRDGALLGVAFSAGLRVGELVAIDLADLDPETGEVKVRHGKGNKQRVAYIRGGLTALQDWLHVRGKEPGPLFCPVRKSGTVVIGAMTTQAVYERFQLRAKQAGLALSFSPHDGRRTWIGNLLESGADIVTVQKMAGHLSVQTTARYDRRDEKVKQRAADLLHFPWGRSVFSEEPSDR